MAYQLQTLPQFEPYDPFGSIAKGYSQGQQATTNRLNQQILKKDIENYDRVLNAELSKMLAATEASEASTNLSNTQRLGADFDNMIKAQYGEKAALADINYKSAIGTASLNNAIIAGINAQIAQQKLPGDIEKINKENELLKMEADLFKKWMIKNGYTVDEPTQGTVDVYPVGTPGAMNDYTVQTQEGGLIPLPPLAGMPSTNESQQGQQVVSEKKSPRDYLTPKVEEQEDPGDVLFGPKFKSEAKRESEKQYAGTEAQQLSKSYHTYANDATDKARVSGEQITLLHNMRNAFAGIPEMNKGEFLGMIKAIPSESQFYEAIKSGAVLEALALQVGTQSETDRQAIERSYGGRTMEEIPMDELLTIKEIENDRRIYKVTDLIAPEIGKGQSPAEVESAWQLWLKDNPLFDDPKYQAYLQRRWSSMSPKEAINDKKRYLDMRESMMEPE